VKRSALLLCVVVLCAGCGGSMAAEPPGRPMRGTPAPPGAKAPDFALRDQDGRLVRLSEQHGRLVVLTFLYTQCTDVCPLIAERTDAAVRALGHRGADVRVLAVSVDPANDTPGAARAFVAAHRLLPGFHYLVGSRAQLAPVWQAYNVAVEASTPDKVAHAAPVLLLDRRGRPRVFYGEDLRTPPLLRDLRRLLRSS
jgi:protein SCO1/2